MGSSPRFELSVRPEPPTQRPGTEDPSSPEAAEAFTSAPFLGQERTELRCSLYTPTPRQTLLFPLPLPLGGATAPARGSLCGAGPARQDSRLLLSAQRRSPLPPPPRQGVRAPGNRGLAESKGGCRGSRDDVDSRAAVAKLTKPRENLNSFCVTYFAAFQTLFHPLLPLTSVGRI